MAYFEPITNEIEEKVWNQFDKSRNSAKKDVEALKKWLDAQPHLPHTLNERQLQSFLLIGRGSVEKTKPKIDMYYTMRSLFPDMFSDSHPFSSRMFEARKFIYTLPLPKLSYDFSRIVLFKLKEVPNPSDLDPSAIFANLMNLIDIRLLEDFCSGHTVLFDLEHCKFQHVTKITPSYVKTIYFIGERALTTRVHGIHLINAPKFFDQVVLLIKSIVKPKLASKIHLHKDFKSVMDSIDKSLVPRDYGGNEKSLDELEGLFSQKFGEYRHFFDAREKEEVVESLRPSKNINDDILGFHGNFKKLDVD